ncbi:MAG: hypothetical protein V4772_23595 [Pseudomonadota bacterium]
MDKRAVKILFDVFWSSAGWKRGPEPATPADFDYAKSRGVMFDPVQLTHTQALNLLLAAIGKLDRRSVADAFVASLSTRRLDWRSALGSYAVFQHLSPHDHEGDGKRCAICGLYTEQLTYDLNMLNFARLKWGGVTHDQPVYAAIDLNLLLKEPLPQPNGDDIRMFRGLVQAITNVPANVTSAKLHAHLPKEIKANKAERDVVVGILGYCGILGTPQHPGFSAGFVPARQRCLPDRHFIDMAYPACWWHGELGIDQGLLQDYFGHLL